MLDQLYTNEKRIFIMSPSILYKFVDLFGDKVRMKPSYSAGFSMSSYYLGDIKLESSIWVDNDSCYYINNNGKVFKLEINRFTDRIKVVEEDYEF